MRMIAIHAQTERKRLDRSVRCAEKRRPWARKQRLRGLIRPDPAVCATAGAACGRKSLSSARIQAIFTSNATPLGECRVKNVPPGRGEVQGWSAHMVIRTKADPTGNHRAAFERMQNVSSTLVQRYLDALLDQATEGKPEYTFEKVLKKGKNSVVETRPYKLRLGINKVPSEDLLNDVKNGALTAITLIRRNPEYSGPGNPTVVTSVKERLVIRTHKLEKDKAIDYIKDVTQWGKSNDYDEVQFSVTDLPGDTSANPRFAIEKADAMDTIYSRTHRITGFQKLLETCYQEIEPEIADKMSAELSNEKLWK